MKVNGKDVTKEWYKCHEFEDILNNIQETANRVKSGKLEFTRFEILCRINTWEFSKNLIASFSPQVGSVEEIQKTFLAMGLVWLDVQNLTYHYSHQNPNGNFHSHKKMLDYLGGEGGNSKYRIVIG
jgi:hypothetical protein